MRRQCAGESGKCRLMFWSEGLELHLIFRKCRLSVERYAGLTRDSTGPDRLDYKSLAALITVANHNVSLTNSLLTSTNYCGS